MRESTRRQALRFGMLGAAAVGSALVLPPVARASTVRRPSTDQLATVRLGTIGETQHGKTTLTAALTTVLAKRFGGRASTFDQIDQAPRETVDGVTYRASRVEYATSSRRYAHVDCPSPTDCAKNLIVSAPRPDSALLVVSALDGRSPRIGEQVRLARETGIVSVVIFLNKCELVPHQATFALLWGDAPPKYMPAHLAATFTSSI
ncbi:GTP-binding protein [Streptomyces rhizosphaericola]|uniref:GTP-binding protein n=1 Tax=Streptomyces rhizosphaericola TaxID=2564098 RepID=UPI003BF5D9DA